MEKENGGDEREIRWRKERDREIGEKGKETKERDREMGDKGYGRKEMAKVEKKGDLT